MFDRTRHDWYPTVTYNGVTFTADRVVSSSGSPRPALFTPLDIFTVHYGGAGAWLDPGDTAQELAAIERNHAIPNNKPNEYNSASDSESVTWEWAGPFRAAHSAYNNSTAWGHLCVLGLETPTASQADRLIEGIRRARRQAVAAGYLTPGHRVLPHRQMPYASTSCPGPLYTVHMWWARIAAPLEPVAPKPPTGGHSVFTKLVRLDGTLAVYAVYSGGYKVWVRNESELAAFRALGADAPEVIPASAKAIFAATGPIMGDRPAGVDTHGLPG